MTARAFVTGWPISHSLSPALHGFWLRRHGIDGTYEALAVAPEEFPAFFDRIPASGFAGGNVTLPHKETAFRLCGEPDDAARAIRAVNTLWLENGVVRGGNTDAHGFAANLDQRAPDWDGSESNGAALVLGAGGAARAILHALKIRGFETIFLANRTTERAEALAAEFGPKIRAIPWETAEAALGDARLLVNTTSLGMSGQPPLPFRLDAAAPGTVVNDLVYSPMETQLLAAAAARGLTPVDGLGMLLHQAVPGFARWFGVTPGVDEELRHHVLAAAAARRKMA
jgi:shikimate dehydrogenase